MIVPFISLKCMSDWNCTLRVGLPNTVVDKLSRKTYGRKSEIG